MQSEPKPKQMKNRFHNTADLQRSDVTSGNHGVITLEWLQSQLLKWLHALLSHLLNLTSENGLWCGGRIDTVGLDGDENTTSDLEEEMGVQANNTGLIWLGNIGEDNIDHGNEHSVAEWVAGILDDWNDVGAVSSHVDQITAGSVGELNSENGTGWADDISNVGNGGSGGSTEVENLCSWLDEDLVETSKDASCDLGSERVPDSVLGLGGVWSSVLIDAVGVLDRDTLLAVNGLSWGQVLGDQHILLPASNEDTSVAMWLLIQQLVHRIKIQRSTTRTTIVLAPPFAPAPPRPLGAPRPPPPRPPLLSPRPPVRMSVKNSTNKDALVLHKEAAV